MKLLQVSNIKVDITEDEKTAFKKALKKAGLSKDKVSSWKIIKLSIDARKKVEMHKVYVIGLYVKEYNKTRKDVQIITKEKEYTYEISGTKRITFSPVVVGFGPAGMFCAYLLALNGYKPIIIERGSMVENRTKIVEDFWNTGVLNTNCNVQFGEGGAGTFSDGKLNTGIKDKQNRIKFVLETFVKFGANEKILYEAKPHIGTDVLKNVVKTWEILSRKKVVSFTLIQGLKALNVKMVNLAGLF